MPKMQGDVRREDPLGHIRRSVLLQRTTRIEEKSNVLQFAMLTATVHCSLTFSYSETKNASPLQATEEAS
jgi:hypothetical protein